MLRKQHRPLFNAVPMSASPVFCVSIAKWKSVKPGDMHRPGGTNKGYKDILLREAAKNSQSGLFSASKIKNGISYRIQSSELRLTCSKWFHTYLQQVSSHDALQTCGQSGAAVTHYFCAPRPNNEGVDRRRYEHGPVSPVAGVGRKIKKSSPSDKLHPFSPYRHISQ